MREVGSDIGGGMFAYCWCGGGLLYCGGAPLEYGYWLGSMAGLMYCVAMAGVGGESGGYRFRAREREQG